MEGVFDNPITHKAWFHFMKPLLVSWCSDLVSPKTYIEIGTWKMGTFEYMNSKLPSGVKMMGFDLFEDAPSEEIAPDEMGLSYDESMKLVSEWDREVVLVKGDTKNTLQNGCLQDIESPVVVYLDGGHSYETVKSDFWNLHSKVDSGFIILDDWMNPDVLVDGINKYGFHYPYYEEGKNFRFMDNTWKFAKELHNDNEINIAYVGDIFTHEGNVLEFMGIVVI